MAHYVHVPSRRIRTLLVLAAAVFTGMGLCATALTPLLATQHPLLLLALESPIRNLLLTRQLDLEPVVAVAVTRRLCGSVVLYLLGRWYGDEALRWIERKLGHGSGFVNKVERAVRVAACPMVFFLPEALVSVLAGSTGMPLATFASVSAAGSLTIVLLSRLLGEALAVPLNIVVALLTQHVIVATTVMATSLGAWMLVQWNRKRVARRSAALALGGPR